MRVYHYYDSPVKIFGLPFFERDKELVRIPSTVKTPISQGLARRVPGARMAFRTNAKRLTVRMTLDTFSPDVGMAIFGCQAATVLYGDRKDANFLGLVNPANYDTKNAERTFSLSGVMQDITVFLPRNEHMADISVEIEDGAEIAPPTPYKYGAVLYYGSSITEGGCCTRMTNAYNALLSAWLDADYYNYGFSGAARGEPEMAEFLATIPAQVFVYDYDHNAPNAEHLARTHEPFFRTIRKAHPQMPVLMLTRPNYWGSADDDRRREIIRATYENAVADGDRNVYFVDGKYYFGRTERSLCTVDNCHPNDLGFYRMARAIEPTLRHILENLQ